MADRSIMVNLRANVTDFSRGMAQARDSLGDLATRAGGAEKVAQTSLGKLEQSARLQRDSWDAAGRTLTGFGAVSIAALGGATMAAVNWESAWAGVTKTVDGSASELSALEGELRGLATTLPATHQEIAAVAEAAGQLGIARGDVSAFTKTMIDLSETTNLTADEAATSIAQLMNVMQTAPEDVDNLGAALVALGNDGASTERDIIQMAQRIASSGKMIGLTEGEVMGLANALASAGIEVEAGGSAISNIMIDIAKAVSSGGDDLEAWARVAGVSASDFAAAWKADPAQAIATLIEGLGKMNAQGKDVFATLDELGQSDVRVTRALLSMANSGDMLRESIELGNAAWSENTALIEEANKRYDTAEAKIQIAKNSIYDAAISMGETFLPVVAGAAEGVAGLAQSFAAMPPVAQGVIGGLTGIAGGATLAGGAFLMLAPRAFETYNHFKLLAETSPGLVSKLGGVAKAAGLVGVALVGMEIVNRLSMLEGVDASISEITASLLDLEGGVSSLDDQFRATVGMPWLKSSTAGVKDAMWQILDYSETFAGKMDQLMPGDSLADRARDNFAKVGEALSILVQSGEIEQAEEMFEALEKQWIEMGGDPAGLLDLMPAYRDALLDVENGADLAEGATRTLTSSTETAAQAAERATNAIGEQNEALLALRDGAMDAARSEMAVEKSIDDLTESLKENGSTLDVNTEKGRANRGAILDVIDAANRHAEALIKDGASIEEVSGFLETSRQRLREQALAAGVSEDAVDDLVDAMLMTPAEVRTNFILTGAQAGLNAIDALNAKLNAINGKTAYAQIRVSGQGAVASGGPITPMADALVRGRAAGGPVHGPGGPTDDLIPALGPRGTQFRLSDGEHVWTAAENAAVGGDAAMYQLRSMALSGDLTRLLSVRRANGGPTSIPRHYVSAAPSYGTPPSAPAVLPDSMRITGKLDVGGTLVDLVDARLDFAGAHLDLAGRAL